MDILAHGLWTNAVFYPKYKNQLKTRLWAVFFGIMPDLISFTPATLYALFNFSGNRLMNLANSQMWVFVWARESYNYTHSLVTFSVVAIIILLARKGKFYWPILGWALHIGIDIFSHKGFYDTPFLFPLSNYKFDYGTSWGHPLFMAINYSTLALIYIFGFIYYRKQHGKAG